MSSFNLRSNMKGLRKKISDVYNYKFSRYCSVKLLTYLYSIYSVNDNIADVVLSIKYYLKDPEEILDETHIESLEKLYNLFKNSEPSPFSNIHIDKENIQSSKIFFNSHFLNLLEEYFNIFSQQKNIIQLRKQEDDEDDEVDNLYTLSQFINKNPEVVNELQQYTTQQRTFYIPSHTIDIQNIHTIINKKIKFGFLLNPLIKKSNKFQTEEVNTVNKYELFIKKPGFTVSNFGEKIVSEYELTCPRCNEKIKYLPFQIRPGMSHGCDDYVDDKGRQKYTPLNSSKPHNSIMKEVFLYETHLINDPKNKIYLYSFQKNLKPGRYIVDVFNSNIDLDGLTGKQTFIILGIENVKVKITEDFINKEVEKETRNYLSNNKEVPYHPILDVVFGIRKMYEKYNNILINDRGMLLQLFTTISGLSKLLFNYNKIAISVMGNTSLSKTYSAHLFGLPFDKDFINIENGDNTTSAGLKGGINNKKLINGKLTSVFEEGVFTSAGLAVFDEAQVFYDDKNINNALKNFLNDEINIAKIGANGAVAQNYTPLLFLNINQHYKNVYTPMVEEEYIKFIKYEHQDDNLPHNRGLRWINNYINNTNLSLPIRVYIENFKNEALAKAITLVRNKLFLNDIDWKTGGSIPSSCRILFDVMCDNQDAASNDKQRQSTYTSSKLPELYEIPWEEFQQYIKTKFTGDRVIDLYKYNNNTTKTNNQLNQLKDSIKEFILTDGVEIHKHLSNNKKEIDPKLNGIMYNVIMTLQLIQNIEATQLSDEVKKWSKLILLKCKRGVTVDEYNFTEHHFKADKLFYDYNNLNVEIQELADKNRKNEEMEIANKLLNLTKDGTKIKEDIEK